jgi:hypothetical protein
MTNQTMATKNSTSTTKDIYMLEPADMTDGSWNNYERPAQLFKYNPKTSSFEYFNWYSRLRDAYRAMLRKSSDNFRIVYLKY